MEDVESIWVDLKITSLIEAVYDNLCSCNCMSLHRRYTTHFHNRRCLKGNHQGNVIIN